MSRRWSRPLSRSARAALAACVAVAALGFAAPGAAAGVLASACTGREQPPDTYRHVLVIVMENHSASQIFGSPKTPYITKVARRCGKAARVPSDHPPVASQLHRHDGWLDRRHRDRLQRMPNERAEHLSPGRPPRPLVEGVRGVDALAVPAGRLGPVSDAAQPGGLLPPSGWHLPNLRPADGDASARSAAPRASQEHAAGLRLPHARRLSRHARLPEVGRRRVASVVASDDPPKPVVPKRPDGGVPDLRRGRRSGEAASGTEQRVATVVLSPYVAAGTASGAPFTHYSLLRTTENLLGLPLLGHARTRSGCGARSGSEQLRVAPVVNLH